MKRKNLECFSLVNRVGLISIYLIGLTVILLQIRSHL